MKLNSTKMLLLWSMTIGVMISMSSNSWIMMWSGIEISMMSLIPLMSSNSILSSESCTKYFIIQSSSSMIMIMSFMMMISKNMLNYEMILLTSLMMKIGVVPFHNWVLSVIEGLNYLMMFNILIIMKMAPLTMMSYLNSMMVMVPMLTMILGSIMGINQNSLRKMLGYSSIFNLGILILSTKSNTVWLSFMAMYTIMMISIISFINKMNFNYINQMSISNHKKMLNLKLWIILISMGGMPPTLGFSAKLLVIEFLIKTKTMMNLTIMIMTSLLVMFFYMRLAISTITYSSNMNKTKLSLSKESSTNLMMINLISLPVMMSLKMMT
uniref:NADH-ubiquinone oxidoreductase chain 2 n=1 Tax=Balala fujiana TaxID=2800226 RepID=A0A7T6YCR0_9HEMI|nr:NADH dehydrogenase subunit 2 [Balala fujiana]QQK57694.1 NADH dehydrogenase subunit 2 [Balala fujiana]